MKVELLFKDSGSYFFFDNVISAFQEDKLYCILTSDCVIKYPIDHIFRIKESDHKK